MRTIRQMLEASPVFDGLPADVLDEIAGCARLQHYEAGTRIFEAGRPASTFMVIRHGRVSVQITAPGRGPIVVRTLGTDDTLGWSWLFPPYLWHFDAVATDLTRVVSFDGECLRGKAATDHELGYHLMSRFAQLVISDLENTRYQLMDVYGQPALR